MICEVASLVLAGAHGACWCARRVDGARPGPTEESVDELGFKDRVGLSSRPSSTYSIANARFTPSGRDDVRWWGVESMPAQLTELGADHRPGLVSHQPGASSRRELRACELVEHISRAHAVMQSVANRHRGTAERPMTKLGLFGTTRGKARRPRSLIRPQPVLPICPARCDHQHSTAVGSRPHLAA